MIQSVERNRERIMEAVLKVLRDNCDELIAYCKFMGRSCDDAETARFEEEHASIDEMVASFDDAIESAIAARNRFVEVKQIGGKSKYFSLTKTSIK